MVEELRIECVKSFMEKNANLPLKKAVNAARFVIRSRTGAAILKTSYQQKSDIVFEKSAHLLSGIQKKEMRKLERDRSRFMKDQNGKLKVFEQSTESLTPRSSHLLCSVSKKTKAAQRLLKENERPTKDSEAKLKEESERKGSTRKEKASKEHQENKYNRDAVLYRRDFVPNFSKSPKPAWEKHEYLEETDEKEDQENSKITENIELTKMKLLHHNLDFFGSDKRLEIWLNEVDLANIDRKLSSERRKRRKQRNSPAKDAEHEVIMPKIDFCDNSELLNTEGIEDSGKSDCNNSSLKLPRLNQTLSSSPVESRRHGLKTASNKSLDDPRFTRLIDSLASSDNSLKLPKIFNKSSDRAG